ncbi:MAG TPA: hypothetical protein PK733_08800 [Clostridiales bacterium]|nr:hypothetical protein [Clostridiales bacterium]
MKNILMSAKDYHEAYPNGHVQDNAPDDTALHADKRHAGAFSRPAAGSAGIRAGIDLFADFYAAVRMIDGIV